MSQKLKNSVQVWRLGRDLGIKITDDPVSAILKYCERRVGRLLGDFTDCDTLTELLDWIANKLGTIFETVSTDDEMHQLKQKYLARGEKTFALLEEELSQNVLGITYRRTNRELWEPQFVSIIDCRGSKVLRAYFTKWHELAHLLTLTDQLRLSFRRTHASLNFDSAEEALMEVIAGHFGFYPPIVRNRIPDKISFEAIETLRREICPEASQQSALIGIVKAWPQTCLLINARLATKKADSLQGNLFASNASTASLRAVHVTANEAAREESLAVFENMRVPETSIIYRVFQGIPYGEAVENLSWWETSKGFRLPDRVVEVKARRSWDSVDALIFPIRLRRVNGQ